MNRRSFLRHFGGLVAAVAVAQGVVRKLVTDVTETVTTKELVFRAEDYQGDWKWIKLDPPYAVEESNSGVVEWQEMDRTYSTKIKA